MASYDYNFDNSPKEDEDNRGGEISDYGLSPLENSSLGISDTIENYADKAVHAAGTVIGAGLSVAGKVFGLFK